VSDIDFSGGDLTETIVDEIGGAEGERRRMKQGRDGVAIKELERRGC
jgi:hypothetical protein